MLTTRVVINAVCSSCTFSVTPEPYV